MKTVKDIDIQGKTVLLRADYNVPIKDGVIIDDYRMRQALVTLEYLLEQNCQVVIISHLGRPEGEVVEEFSLAPVAEHLSSLINQPVVLAKGFDEVDSSNNQITLLENLRFWPGEEAGDLEFAKKLAGLGEVFIQDGFGVVHRSHASIELVAKLLPSVAGLLLDREISTITQAMEQPDRPLTVILGGAKVSDKIGVIERFIDVADHILIGGAMANTFLAYQEHNMGASLVETDQDEVITRLGNKALTKNTSDQECECSLEDKVCFDCIELFELPSDVAVAKAIEEDQQRKVVEIDKVSDDDYVLDIGPDTIKRYQDIIAESKTVIWNGPVGYSELPEFSIGSNSLADEIKSHRSQITSIIGGGDTAAFVLNWDDEGSSFTHVSTGGGAALDLMAGKELPGIKALD